MNYRQDYASSFVIFPGVEDAVGISDEVDSRSRDEWLRHWGDWRLTNPRCLSRLTLWSWSLELGASTSTSPFEPTLWSYPKYSVISNKSDILCLAPLPCTSFCHYVAPTPTRRHAPRILQYRASRNKGRWSKFFAISHAFDTIGQNFDLPHSDSFFTTKVTQSVFRYIRRIHGLLAKSASTELQLG